MPEKETMKTPCFTLHYAAPEVIRQALGQNEEGYDASCDLWSLGVILVIIIIKKLESSILLSVEVLALY